MVRFKTRYLLFNILYPDATLSDPSSPLPTHLDFHSATDPSVTAYHLTDLIRSSIHTHFGDWGSGVTLAMTGKKIPTIIQSPNHPTTH